ncbi:MAG TPA: hypothetical protein VFH10_00840 [Nocardioides sp.]|uniref:hypothetical protein n=1 Tax=Nocardioides sp. TaxID=35761 RepID=UPI002D80C052|nr:hypothetical protein [Nocardioides sp.]HET6651157.1 hypothetical protein [Nocardioides sp.]
MRNRLLMWHQQPNGGMLAVGTKATRQWLSPAGRALVIGMLFATVLMTGAVPFQGTAARAAGVGYLEGRVVDQAGTAARVYVRVFPVGSAGEAGQEFSHPFTGGYRVGPLPEGQYQVLFTSEPGGTPDHWAWQWHGNHTARAASPPIAVTADTTTAGVDAVVQRGGRFIGRVRSSDRRPIGLLGCCSAKDAQFQPTLYADVRVRSVDLARDVGGTVADMHVTGSNTISVETDEYFAYGLQTADYRIYVEPRLPGYKPTWFDHAATEDAAQRVAGVAAVSTTPRVVTFDATRRHLWAVKRLTWSGTARVGQTVRITSPGEWNKRPDSYRFSWHANDQRLKRGRTLTLTSKLKGVQTLSACVSARRDGFAKASQCRFLPRIRSPR